MKKTLLIAAVALMATPAMASKARLTSLSNAKHIEDIQNVFENPAKITKHGDWATFEMGATVSGDQTAPANTVPNTPYAGTAAPTAEGGFSRSAGDARYGFYLGHHANWVQQIRQPNAFVITQTMLIDVNPINIFYASKAGDLAWGVGLNYSNTDFKSTARKQTTTGLTAGVDAGVWEASLDLGLVNTYKSEDNPQTGATENAVDFKGTTAVGLRGEYNIDTMTVYAGYAMNGGKTDVAGAAQSNIELAEYSVGVENSHKSDGADFFYGTAYKALTYKQKEGTAQKFEASQLPVYAGIEADATSWMVLRASVAQNFVLGSVKNEFGGSTETDTVANNTVVAAGAGLKFGKLLLDGTLAGSTTGNVNGGSMLANAALTYMF